MLILFFGSNIIGVGFEMDWECYHKNMTKSPKSNVKSKLEILVAFSEYMKFKSCISSACA